MFTPCFTMESQGFPPYSQHLLQRSQKKCASPTHSVRATKQPQLGFFFGFRFALFHFFMVQTQHSKAKSLPLLCSPALFCLRINVQGHTQRCMCPRAVTKTHPHAQGGGGVGRRNGGGSCKSQTPYNAQT